MTHIENIQKIFSKKNVESLLLETIEAGKILIPTGKIVACDPLITKDMPSFEIEFPKGEFPVFIHKEKESNCIAYAEIIFSDMEADTFKMATLQGQDIKELKEGEIFGYPVKSGMGSFMDEDTQKSLNELEELLFERKGDDFMGIYEEFFHPHFFDEKGAIDQYASLKPNDEKPENIFAFETGYGEGFYASYIGFKNGAPVKLVTEFIEVV